MANTSKKTLVNQWAGRLFHGLPMRFIERFSRGWVRCDIPRTSTVMGFTIIDDNSLIGGYTFINRFCEVTCASIGNYCSIGSSVRIGSGEHDFSQPSTSAFATGYVAGDLTKQPCTLGHDVWVGTHAFIKRGVTIGHGAVIGSHAVVVNDVPAFAIVVGNPARIVKYRFSIEMRAAITSSEWWNLDLDQAKRYLKNLIM